MRSIHRIFTVACFICSFIAPQIEAAGGPFWTENGVAICDTTGTQSAPQLISDGAGGAIIVWEDIRGGVGYDIYAQRVDPVGNQHWTVNGVAICDTTSHQTNPQLVSDGAGGAIIVWQDSRSGDYDIYAQHVLSSGLVWWGWDGYQICGFTGSQLYPQAASDDSGGAFIVWADTRSGTYDIYGERVNHWGENEWSTIGLRICDATNNQSGPQIVADGFGNAFLTWFDYRNGNADIYAQHMDAGGHEQWTTNGEAVCDTSGSQRTPQLASDGSGGCFITWEDYRDGNYDIYAQHIDDGGNQLWTSNGARVCDFSGHQRNPQIVGNGSGGAIIVWEDDRNGNDDIYAQRIDADGNVKWGYNGLAICAAAGTQLSPQLVSDGSDGAIFCWEDERGGAFDIYAQRVDAYGNIQWTADGVVICDELFDQTMPQLVGDDSGGAIIAWEDERAVNKDIYAQYVLELAPQIASIVDVPQDQGRQVMIHWDRSALDQPKFQLITDYSIWRRSPLGAKIEVSGQEYDGTLAADRGKRIYRLVERATVDGGMKAEYWEYMGSVDAHFLEGYAYIAPTLEDSSAGGTPYFSFFVSAETADPFVFYDSDPDSGYSVDDIAPAKTQMSVLAAGGSSKGPVNTAWLAWNQVTTGVDGSPEQGPIEYRIYCDEDPDFTPGPGNILKTLSDLSLEHTDGRIGDPAANLFYLVTVTDGSSNESAVSNRVGEFDRSLSNAK
jgi:hypothetical protein